jgi:hypothetical protein
MHWREFHPAHYGLRLWPILLTFIIVSTIAIFALTRIEDHILRRILGVARNDELLPILQEVLGKIRIYSSMVCRFFLKCLLY